MSKVILIILDGLGYEIARSLLGNIEGWVAQDKGKVWRMSSVLPSTSGPCYASIHTGLHPQEHGILRNDDLRWIDQPDIFSAARAAGKRTGAVAHSYFSTYFQADPFDPVEHLEVTDESLPIQFARFYTMAGETKGNLAIPSDYDLCAQVTLLAKRHSPDYMLMHTCTTDSIGHAYGPHSIQMDQACYVIDGALSHYLPKWREMGYEVMITADHGHSERGHHGGTTSAMRQTPFYYFGEARGPEDHAELCQTAIAPTVLSRLGVGIPNSMKTPAFL